MTAAAGALVSIPDGALVFDADGVITYSGPFDAVTVGGGKNHRMGLDDGILIKDNHIALAGGVKEAVRAAKSSVGHLHKIEVEITNWAQLREAVEAGADIIMIDNQTPSEAQKLVETDPVIKSGMMIAELTPWYGSAATMLVNENHKKIAKKSF